MHEVWGLGEEIVVEVEVEVEAVDLVEVEVSKVAAGNGERTIHALSYFAYQGS